MRHQKVNAENRVPCWMFALCEPALWITRHCCETTAPYPCPQTPMKARASFLAHETTRIANMNQYTPQSNLPIVPKNPNSLCTCRYQKITSIYLWTEYTKKNVQKNIHFKCFDIRACSGRHIWNGCSEFLNHKQNTSERKYATHPTHKSIFHTVVKHQHCTSTLSWQFLCLTYTSGLEYVVFF